MGGSVRHVSKPLFSHAMTAPATIPITRTQLSQASTSNNNQPFDKQLLLQKNYESVPSLARARAGLGNHQNTAVGETSFKIHFFSEHQNPRREPRHT
jgi:hypothetical protein